MSRYTKVCWRVVWRGIDSVKVMSMLIDEVMQFGIPGRCPKPAAKDSKWQIGKWQSFGGETANQPLISLIRANDGGRRTPVQLHLGELRSNEAQVPELKR